jgi:hypothetical protein
MWLVSLAATEGLLAAGFKHPQEYLAPIVVGALFGMFNVPIIIPKEEPKK